jgi:hypothetical protein
MIAVAFALFALLVIGWLVAPSGEVRVAPESAASLRAGEAHA